MYEKKKNMWCLYKENIYLMKEIWNYFFELIDALDK